MSAVPKSRVDFSPATKPEQGDRVLLHDISWQTYKTIREALREKYVFLTYSNGVLEIMTLSVKHERYKTLFGLLVFLLARFFRKKVGGFGSFTHQRDDIEKGLEPDECFYLASLPAVRGKKHIDLMRDPPPDLAVEIDITSISLNRLPIYQALRVPEIWVFDGETLCVLVLRQGVYKVFKESPTFPGFPINELVRFLELGIQEDEIAMAEALEKWLPKQTNRRKGKKK